MICGCERFINTSQVGVTCDNVSIGVFCGRLRGVIMAIVIGSNIIVNGIIVGTIHEYVESKKVYVIS